MISTSRIEERMAALSLNPYSTAKKAGLGQDYVRDLIRGKVQEPSANKLRELAVALECSTEYLQGIGEDLGSAPLVFGDHSKTRVARLNVARVIKKGFFKKAHGIGHRPPKEDSYSVVSYSIGSPEWLELIEGPVTIPFVTGSYVHVVEMDKYYDGMTEFIVTEESSADGVLVERAINRIVFSAKGLTLSYSGRGNAMKWDELLSGENPQRVKAVGLVLRAYQFFDGGLSEDSLF